LATPDLVIALGRPAFDLAEPERDHFVRAKTPPLQTFIR